MATHSVDIDALCVPPDDPPLLRQDVESARTYRSWASAARFKTKPEPDEAVSRPLGSWLVPTQVGGSGVDRAGEHKQYVGKPVEVSVDAGAHAVDCQRVPIAIHAMTLRPKFYDHVYR